MQCETDLSKDLSVSGIKKNKNVWLEGNTISDGRDKCRFLGPMDKLQHRGFSVFEKRSQTAAVSLQPSLQQGRGVSVHQQQKGRK